MAGSSEAFGEFVIPSWFFKSQVSPPSFGWCFSHCVLKFLEASSSRYFSTSSAAMQPEPAAVIAWR